MKIALLGAESTGKTRLAGELEAHLRQQGKSVAVVGEVLRVREVQRLAMRAAPVHSEAARLLIFVTPGPHGTAARALSSSGA